MDHVALDRPGPDDRDLDDQVVEALGPQPRQHVHLRPALDLEDAEAVGPAQHGVGRRVSRAARLARSCSRPVVPAQQVEAAAQAGQHAEAEHIDLEDAERVDVVLVPLDDGAARHGGVVDHGELDQRPAGDDEAADMGGEMAGEVQDLLGQLQRHGQARVARCRAPRPRPALGRPVSCPAPQLPFASRAVTSSRQAQRLADLADGAAGAVADDGGGRSRPGRGRSGRRGTGSPPRGARARSRCRCRAARRGWPRRSARTAGRAWPGRPR